MKVCIVANPRADHQMGWGGAFAEGLRRHGHQAETYTSPMPCDLLVLWGVRRQAEIAAQKKIGEVCILERGYIGDRYKWTSVSFGGGLNGHGIFRGTNDDRTRFDVHFGHLLRPWVDRDGPVIIMGQVPGDMSLKGIQAASMWEAAGKEIRSLGLTPLFRPHPLASRVKVKGVDNFKGTLDDALAQASFVVTINSNSGVDAVLSGVPTVTFDDRSMAWPVTSHYLSCIYEPDRTGWATHLSWKQWSESEIRSGECWDKVRYV